MFYRYLFRGVLFVSLLCSRDVFSANPANAGQPDPQEYTVTIQIQEVTIPGVATFVLQDPVTLNGFQLQNPQDPLKNVCLTAGLQYIGSLLSPEDLPGFQHFMNVRNGLKFFLSESSKPFRDQLAREIENFVATQDDAYKKAYQEAKEKNTFPTNEKDAPSLDKMSVKGRGVAHSDCVMSGEQQYALAPMTLEFNFLQAFIGDFVTVLEGILPPPEVLFEMHRVRHDRGMRASCGGRALPSSHSTKKVKIMSCAMTGSAGNICIPKPAAVSAYLSEFVLGKLGTLVRQGCPPIPVLPSIFKGMFLPQNDFNTMKFFLSPFFTISQQPLEEGQMKCFLSNALHFSVVATRHIVQSDTPLTLADVIGAPLVYQGDGAMVLAGLVIGCTSINGGTSLEVVTPNEIRITLEQSGMDPALPSL